MTRIDDIPQGMATITFNWNIVKPSHDRVEGDELAYATNETPGEPGAVLRIVGGIPVWSRSVKPKEDLFDSLYKRMMK